MIPVVDPRRDIETNIARVRTLVAHGLTLQEVISTITDMPPSEIFLAFHAAKILESK